MMMDRNSDFYFKKLKSKPFFKSIAAESPYFLTLLLEYLALKKTSTDIEFAQTQIHSKLIFFKKLCSQIPYYHKHSIELPITQWPTINRKIVKDNFEHLLFKPTVSKSVQKQSTGTTGTPIQVLHSDTSALLEQMLDRFIYKHKVYGKNVSLTPFSSVIHVSAITDASERKSRSIFLNFSNRIKLNLDICGFPMFQQMLNRFKPELLITNPTSLQAISEKLVLRKNDYFPSIIRTSAATLTPTLRENIFSKFGAEIFDQYVSTEFLKIGFECKLHNGFHCPDIFNYIEILHPNKDEPLQDGEIGEITITGLRNITQPLIRYRTGDLGSLDRSSCPCGLRFPRITNFIGKSIYVFKNQDGTVVYPQYLFNKFTQFKTIDQYQVTQVDFNQFTVRLRLRDNDPSEYKRIQNAFHKNLEHLMQLKVTVTFEPMTDEIKLNQKLAIFKTNL